MSLFPKKHSQRRLFFLQINEHDDQYPSSSSSTFLPTVPDTFPNTTTHPIHPPFNDGVHTPPLYSLYLLLLITVGCSLTIGIPLAVLHYCRRRRTNPTNTRNLAAQETRDENHQVGLFSIPNWFFNGTAGLRQSQINSLPVFGYGEDSGVIEGIECSVCLCQFEEGERLRLLPRCNHAFHVACIDTWLKSRKNCPLCRASIAGDGNGSRDPSYRVDDVESGGHGINNIRQEGCEDSSSRASPEWFSTMTVHAPADEAQITEMTNVKPNN